MPSGTLENLSTSGFVRTPPAISARIVANLLSFGASVTVLDPTSGAGDFLLPCAALSQARLLGIETSDDRATIARQRLPEAQILTSDCMAVRVTPGSVELLLANPPYFFVDGQRAEYRIIKRFGEALCPGGVLVAILPARSAWTDAMIRHMATCYHDVRCWKFPDVAVDGEGDFARYTQIIVAGIRNAVPCAAPDPAAQARFKGWRWTRQTGAASPWGQGTPPPDLPDLPIPDPYRVPDAGDIMPAMQTLHATEAQLLEALTASGAHLAGPWRLATTWEVDVAAERPAMPPTGEAHLAADILTGLLDGEVICGPTGERCVFSSFVSSTWVDIPVDDEVLQENHAKGVVRMSIRQMQDHMVLGVLNLESGAITYYQGEEVFGFLAPWMAILAAVVLTRRQPLYALHPYQWEMRAVVRIGRDKRLPHAAHPGLVPPQQHRVYALGRALDHLGAIALQGEPGTGKTRQALALGARQAVIWRRPREVQAETGGRLPTWRKRLRQAWLNNPRLRALLPPGATGPSALPMLVMTPKRVTKTWRAELEAAYPEAEYVVIQDYHDIVTWLRRCATSTAPLVLAIASHSHSRAFGRAWRPAVIEQQVRQRVPLLDPPPGEVAAYVAIKEHDQIVGYRAPATGELVTTLRTVTRFRCPHCGVVIRGKPYGGQHARAEVPAPAPEPTAENLSPAAEEDNDILEVVTNRTYFTTRPRTCPDCGDPLWTAVRTNPKQRGIPFGAWAAAVAAQEAPALQAADAAAHALAIQARQCASGTNTLSRDLCSSSPPAPPRRLPAERSTGGREAMKATRIVAADGTRGAPPPDSFSPYEYLRQFFPGAVGLLVIDESHNGRGRATDIAQSMHNAMLASVTHVLATGTHYGGSLDGFFHYWFRFQPRFWLRLGLGWDDVEEALRTYGVIEQTTKEYEEDARRGTGQTDKHITTLPAPGISARLIPHLLQTLVFLTILDVGAFMPPRKEIPVIVSMQDPELQEQLDAANAAHQATLQRVKDAHAAIGALPPTADPATVVAALEAEQQAVTAETAAREQVVRTRDWVDRRNLYAHYLHLVEELQEYARQQNTAALLAKGTVPRWFAALPCSDPAYHVIARSRDEWGNVTDTRLLTATPILEASWLYPLERELLHTVAREIAEPSGDPADPTRGRRVMIYVEQNDIRSMGERLRWVLREFDPWLLPNEVAAEEREDALRAAVARGHQVVIVPYKRVSEGLNLQFLDSIIWYEMAQNLFHLDQASRRAWRLGKANEVRIYYLAYAGSAAHHKLQKLGSQSGAAAAFAGEPAKGALVEHAGAHKTMLARLSQTLEAVEQDLHRATDDELRACFAQRDQELAAALASGRAWMGLDDPLPRLLEPIYAELADALRTDPIAMPLPRPSVGQPCPAPAPAAPPARWAGPIPPVGLPTPIAPLPWNDPVLFAQAFPRRAKKRAGRPGVASAAPPARVHGVTDHADQTAQPFPPGSLWACLAENAAAELAARHQSPDLDTERGINNFP